MRYSLNKLLPRGLKEHLLGDSMLARARTTSFAMLGASAAVGLAVLAIALQESWPLVPGSPPPRPLVRHEGIGEATAVQAAQPALAGGGRAAAVTAARAAVRARAAHAARPAPAVSAVGPAPSRTSELVVSPSVPARAPRGAPAHTTQPPPTQPQPSQPKPPSRPQPAPVAAPPSPASPPPAPTPAPAPAATASASSSEQSYVPPWSNGHGHAYGREEGGHGEGGDSGHGQDD